MESVVSLRQASGMSQSQFAKRFGIPVRTLQQWEQGRSNPPGYVVSMMSEILRRSSVLDFECDVWTNYSADDRLKAEIGRKGVVVYDAG